MNLLSYTSEIYRQLNYAISIGEIKFNLISANESYLLLEAIKN